jgi:hypothetical protein
MKRGLVVVLALTLATLATIGVFLYSVPGEPTEPGPMVPVVVSKVNIPARTDLNELIKDEKFQVIKVLPSARVDGAVTSVDQLMDRHNSRKILAGEQLLVGMLRGT